jgi:serine/threonine protein kinase
MKPATSTERRDIDREIAILRLLKHPNIVQLVDVIDDSGCVYLIFEHVGGGDMFDYLVGRGKLKEKEARKLFRQILSALEYCHAHLVVHRDIKPENLLMDQEGNIKISGKRILIHSLFPSIFNHFIEYLDFGLSNIMTPGIRLSTYCGSPIYMAPEILLNQSYGPEVDVWSLGMCAFSHTFVLLFVC